MAGGKIDCYLDIVSPYSYFAFLYLLKHEKALKTYDVEIEFHPIFLGGVNVGSGNKPPWTLPAKAKYSTFDAARARKYFGVPETSTPSFFPILSLLPQRALTYIKAHYPPSTFRSVFELFFRSMWTTTLHRDLSSPALLHTTLTEAQLFSPAEVAAIIAGASDKKYKDRLLAETEKVVVMGAFGAPFFWVRNAKGQEEMFFGSDRFHFMWEYLGLEWQDIKLLEKGVGAAKAQL